jgi:hypothetical protein
MSPYVEAAPPTALNVYGQTKLDGEMAIRKSGVEFLILRTFSVFSLHQPCFLTKIIEKAQREKEVKVRAALCELPGRGNRPSRPKFRSKSEGTYRTFSFDPFRNCESL